MECGAFHLRTYSHSASYTHKQSHHSLSPSLSLSVVRTFPLGLDHGSLLNAIFAGSASISWSAASFNHGGLVLLILFIILFLHFFVLFFLFTLV